MKRANRHAVDPHTPQLIHGSVAIKAFDGKVCIEINTKVHASMKDEMYDNVAYFGDNTLQYCQCNCKAVSCNNERVVCVHTPSVGVMLSHFLMDGIAEHVIVKISNLG